MFVHHNIADLYRTLNLPADEEIDFTFLSIPAIHPHLPYKSPVMRANYFAFILNIKGTGVYCLDDQRFPFDDGTLYFANPGHVKAYELTKSDDAFIVALSERFLREHVSTDIYIEFPFLLAETAAPRKLDDNDFAEFRELYAHIGSEFNRISEYKAKILGSLLRVLLLKMKEKFWPAYDPLEEGNRNSRIVTTFKQLLESEFRKLLENGHTIGKIQAADFAGKMNLHPNYLNSVIKTKTGRTVNDWLSDRTLLLAKSLLMTTNLSAKEIAYKLGYSEPTHFSRFFKKHTQLSPGAFRKSVPVHADI